MAAEHFFIFSYGSNLLLQRIRERVASVEVIGSHELIGYQLLFNKQSVDESTKANIAVADDKVNAVYGIIHRISLADKPVLDEYEALGKGYNHVTFDLQVEGGSQTVYAYIATEVKYLAEGQPYDWYLNLVIAGAEENKFPEAHTNQLRAINCKMDLDVKRRQANEEILKRASLNNR